MLHRAASNAYSWWWASHIRTKQSKWLDQNLEDVEEKVTGMLKIIDDEGDSFAQRAEMYYKKRPELVSIVEETYRSYRALAERYDHLSKDLQSANRTIASVFPDRVPYAMDEEDEENAASLQTSTSLTSPRKPPGGIGVGSGGLTPQVPKASFIRKDFRSQSMLSYRKGQPKKAYSLAKGVGFGFPSSGLSKSEALEEIDKLQKEILAFQTEKEFMKSSYEEGYKKFCELEEQIIEKQKRVCSLQDEFGIASVIDDDEARTLMATRALKSCQESLDKLMEKHEQSTEEARVETRRIKHVNKKFEAIRNKFNCQQHQHTNRVEKHYEDPETPTTEEEEDYNVYENERVKKQRRDLEVLRKDIENQLAVGSNGASLTMSQLAAKIDDLVQRVVNLETAVFSENALVMSLRSDANRLQQHVNNLEEDKEALIEGSDMMKNRMNELEGELSKVKDLVKTVLDQNNSLKTHFTEAMCNVNHLSEKLQAVKMDEEPEMKLETEMEELHETNQLEPDNNDDDDDNDDGSALKDEGTQDVSADHLDSEPGLEPDKEDGKYLSETASSVPDNEIEELGSDDQDEEKEQPNWRQLFLNGLDDREKILLDEYSSVLRNYKDVRKKLNDVEKKNRDGFFELAMQIGELKNALAIRDGEIEALRAKKGLDEDENNKDGNSGEYEGPRLSASQQSTLTYSIQTSPISVQQHEKAEGNEKVVEPSTGPGSVNDSPKKMGENVLQEQQQQQQQEQEEEEKERQEPAVILPRPVVTIEDKIRSAIDDLLEENLEFWLRFSTCFHQIQKYQTSVQDLKAELSIVREKKNQQPIKSEVRPIYSHLREIKTELTLWLENNAVLKDEVQGRYSSLCNIQEEIVRVAANGSERGGGSRSRGGGRETELNKYQAAKFQGEVLNMKQENKKVADELKGGFVRVKQLKHEVEKVMAELEKEIGESSEAAAAAAAAASRTGSKTGRLRIPLRSFLFGIKLKKQSKAASMFACGHPTLMKQYSFIEETEKREPTG